MKYPNEIKNLITAALDKLPLEIGSRHIRAHLEMALIELNKAMNLEKKSKVKSRRI